jgi:hypothetical protein
MSRLSDDFEDLSADPLIIRTMETGVLGLDRTLSAIKTFDISLFELEEGLRMWSATRRELRGRLKYCFPYWRLNQGGDSWDKLHPLFFTHLSDFFQKHFPVRNITEDSWMGEGFLPDVPIPLAWRGTGPYSRSDRSRYDIKRLSLALYMVGRQTNTPGLPYEMRSKVNFSELSKAENITLEEIKKSSLEVVVRGGLRSKLLKESAEHFERENKQWDIINARLMGGFFKRPDDEDVKP